MIDKRNYATTFARQTRVLAHRGRYSEAEPFFFLTSVMLKLLKGRQLDENEQHDLEKLRFTIFYDLRTETARADCFVIINSLLRQQEEV